MKKIILLSLLMAMFFNTNFAQNNKEDLNQQMDQMELQLKEMMQQLQSTMGEMPFLSDTVFLKRFDGLELNENQLPFGGADFDFGEMLKQFETQIQQLEDSDFEQLQKLFDQLQLPPSNFDQFKENTPEDKVDPKDKKKAKKKRKTYKI